MDKQKKVLLIEDEIFIRDLYQLILVQAGFQIIAAADGEEGLQKAQEIHPDVILLDIMLPKINGMEVLRQLKAQEDTKSIPVVLLTNLGQSNVIKYAYDLGAQGYLLKLSVSPTSLIKTVNDFLANPNTKMDFSTLTLD